MLVSRVLSTDEESPGKVLTLCVGDSLLGVVIAEVFGGVGSRFVLEGPRGLLGLLRLLFRHLDIPLHCLDVGVVFTACL